MKPKRKLKSAANDNGVEIISLRGRQALILANDRMNEQYGGEYIAYLDRQHGMSLHRRIIAHSKSIKAVNDAIDQLPEKDQRDIVVHYAQRGSDIVVELPSIDAELPNPM